MRNATNVRQKPNPRSINLLFLLVWGLLQLSRMINPAPERNTKKYFYNIKDTSHAEHKASHQSLHDILTVDSILHNGHRSTDSSLINNRTFKFDKNIDDSNIFHKMHK